MFYTKRKAALFFIVCLIFFFLTYNDVKSSEINSVSGYAKVTDGDTLKINTFKIRLHGIDAPEKKQLCKRAYLTIMIFTFYILNISIFLFPSIYPPVVLLQMMHKVYHI